MTDAQLDLDWNDALTWLDRLRERPEDEILLEEFEAWLAAGSGRAGICRKLSDVERLAPRMSCRPVEDTTEKFTPDQTTEE